MPDSNTFEDSLTCSISQLIMRDPVIIAGVGTTYERDFILHHVAHGYTLDPLTKQRLPSPIEPHLTANQNLKTLCESYLANNPDRLVDSAMPKKAWQRLKQAIEQRQNDYVINELLGQDERYYQLTPFDAQQQGYTPILPFDSSYHNQSKALRWALDANNQQVKDWIYRQRTTQLSTNTSQPVTPTPSNSTDEATPTQTMSPSASTSTQRPLPRDTQEPLSANLFWEALANGDLEYVQAYINQGGSLYQHDNHGNNALHIAIKHMPNTSSYAHLNLVQWLLQQDQERANFYQEKLIADANNECKQTPGHFAAKYGKREVLQLLKSYNVDPLAQDRYGNTMLHTAIEKRQSHLIEPLIDLFYYTPSLVDKCNGLDTPLLLACHHLSGQYVPKMIQFGANPMQLNQGSNAPIYYITDGEALNMALTALNPSQEQLRDIFYNHKSTSLIYEWLFQAGLKELTAEAIERVARFVPNSRQYHYFKCVLEDHGIRISSPKGVYGFMETVLVKREYIDHNPIGDNVIRLLLNHGYYGQFSETALNVLNRNRPEFKDLSDKTLQLYYQAHQHLLTPQEVQSLPPNVTQQQPVPPSAPIPSEQSSSGIANHMSSPSAPLAPSEETPYRSQDSAYLSAGTPSPLFMPTSQHPSSRHTFRAPNTPSSPPSPTQQSSEIINMSNESNINQHTFFQHRISLGSPSHHQQPARPSQSLTQPTQANNQQSRTGCQIL